MALMAFHGTGQESSRRFGARVSRRTRAPKRLIRLGLGFSATVALICAAMPGAHAASRANAAPTLTFAAWDTVANANAYVQPCVKKLHIPVKYSFVPRDGFETKMETQFAAGTAPDIYDAPEASALNWASQGQALDQLPYRKKLGIPYNNVVPQARYAAHGKLYLTGYIAEATYLYYNKALFKQAGLSAPPSDAAHAWTWKQFVAVAKKLTVDRHGKHPGQAGFDPKHIVRYGVSMDPTQWYVLLPLVASNGGRAFDTSYRHFTLNDPAASQVVQAIADLALKDHVMPTPAQSAAGAGSITLASGRLAMQLDGNWELNFYTYPKVTFPWGIGVLPKFKQYRSFYWGAGDLVWSKTRHPREAVEMVNCFAQTGALASYKTGLWLPSTKNMLYGSGYKTWADTPSHPDNFHSVAIDTIKDGVDPPFLHMTQFGPAWDNVIVPAIQKVDESGNAQSVMASIKARVDATIAQGH